MIRAALVATSVALLHGVPVTRPSTAVRTTIADTSSFNWTGTVPTGSWLRVRNIAGTVEVRHASGSTISVHATKEPESDRWTWDSSPVEPVRFVTERHGSDVVVCAISNAVPRCDPNDLSSPDRNWNDDWHPQAMHIVVQLPAGVSLQTGTMHGDLVISDASAEVIARSGHGNVSVRNVAGVLIVGTGHGDVDVINAESQVTANTGHGNVTVSSGGAVHATTGHGDIVVSLASAAAAGSNNMMFQTGHGNVSVSAPRSLSGDIDLHTGRGHVSTDFPLTMNDASRYDRAESAHGTLGGGGRTVRLSSGRGDINLISKG